MATVRVTGPDGGVYEVNAPDGATDADIVKMVQTQFKAPSVPTAPPTPAKEDFGVDFSKPIPEVRAAISQLPSDKRKRAMDAWADNYVSSEQRTGKGFEDVVRTVARGTPVGSWLDELSAGTVGLANKISGGAIGAPYDENLAYYRARDRQFDKANPKTSMGLQIGGALASAPFTPMLRATQGATMLGKTANAALTGAAYGGLYGAGLGEGDSDTVQKTVEGAALGGVLGGAVAPVSAGLSNAYKYVRDGLRPLPQELQGTSRGAVDRVSRAMIDGGVAPPNGIAPPPPGTAANARLYQNQSRELGGEAMLADMSSNLTGQAAGLATSPGRGQDIVRNAIEERARGAAQRIRGDTDAVLGPAQNLVQLEQAVTQGAKDRARPLYEAFYNTPIRADSELVGILQRVPQSAWAKAQQLATAEGVDLGQVINTGRGIDLMKRAIDDIARAEGRGTNGERVYSGLARDLRSSVDRMLSPRAPDQSVWAMARREAGEGLQFREALGEGRQAFARGTHPDQLRADINGMNAVERQGYQEGARGQIRDIMGNAATAAGENGATKARAALGSEFAREKLQMIVPPAGPTNPLADPRQLIRRLDAETRFADTQRQVVGNSETARRLAAQKEIPNPAARSETLGNLRNVSVSGVLAEGATKAVNAMLGGAINARNDRIGADMARLLVEQGSRRDEVARALMAYQQGRAVTASQKNALEAVMTKLLQAPRQQVIGGASAN